MSRCCPQLLLWACEHQRPTLVKWEPLHLHFLGVLAADPFILPQQDPGNCTETLGCWRHVSLFCLQEQHPQRSSFKGCHPQICLWGIRTVIFLCVWVLFYKIYNTRAGFKWMPLNWNTWSFMEILVLFSQFNIKEEFQTKAMSKKRLVWISFSDSLIHGYFFFTSFEARNWAAVDD